MTDEDDLFAEVFQDVTPLKGRAVKKRSKKPLSVKTKKRPPPVAPQAVQKISPTYEEISHGTASGVDRRTAEKLKKGRMPIEGRLDLHGKTQSEAHSALLKFLEKSTHAGKRCVLVITGKGSREAPGVLKENLPTWLNAPAVRPLIVSFSYAQPKDGGEGAVYILLRRQR